MPLIADFDISLPACEGKRKKNSDYPIMTIAEINRRSIETTLTPELSLIKAKVRGSWFPNILSPAKQK